MFALAAATVEFGTALIYTCPVGCWDDDHGTYQDESVIVQADLDLDFLNKKGTKIK